MAQFFCLGGFSHPHLALVGLYRELETPEPGVIIKDTKKYLAQQNPPADFFTNLTNAQLLEQKLAKMFGSPTRKKRIVEEKKSDRPNKGRQSILSLTIKHIQNR